MADPLDDQAQTRLALASLFVALAQTLGEQDKSFPSRFDKNIERIYDAMREYESVPVQTIESLRWAHELIHVNS